MRFLCSASAMMDGLQIVTKALPNRTPNQILEGVLIETDLDEVILTCSDERITIVTRIEAQVSEPGRGVKSRFEDVMPHASGRTRQRVVIPVDERRIA